MAPGVPRFSIGRSLSSGGLSSPGLSSCACACACDCGDGVADEEEGETGVVAGLAAPGEPLEAGAVCGGVAGSMGGSVDLGLSLLLRRSTGGPSSSFRPRGTDGTGFFFTF